MRATTIILLTAISLFSACKSNGCKDENAVNYNQKADQDDGSCVYYTFLDKLTEGPWKFSSVETIDTLQIETSNYYKNSILTFFKSDTVQINLPADSLAKGLFAYSISDDGKVIYINGHPTMDTIQVLLLDREDLNLSYDENAFSSTIKLFYSQE